MGSIEEERSRLRKRLEEAVAAREETIQEINGVLEPIVIKECSRCVQTKVLYEKELKKDKEKTLGLQTLRTKAIQSQIQLETFLNRMGVSTSR